jgi:hypothetical protein
VPDALNEYIYLNPPNCLLGRQRDSSATDRTASWGQKKPRDNQDKLNRYVISAALLADLMAKPAQDVRRPAIGPLDP